MSTLIIGGLFALALIALVALAFILRTEGKPPQPLEQAVPSSPTMSQGQLNAQAAQTIQTAQIAPGQAVQTIQGATPVEQAETTPVTPASAGTRTSFYDGQNTRRNNELPIYADGQFYEIANNLRTLHQQSIEMEQRLDSLAHMVDTIEREQGQHGVSH